MPRCHVCGTDELMAYKCTYCGRTHCGSHRLPESHMCPELALAAEARAQRERLGGSGVRTPIKVQVEPPSGAGAQPRWEGKLAIGFLIAAAVTFILEGIVGFPQTLDPNDPFRRLFILDATWPEKPWTLITSIFAHGSLQHLFFNGLALFFFGPLIERRLGSKRFALLFVGGGVLAGLAEIHVMEGLLGQPTPGVLGASGAVMAIAGGLTMLAPRLQVLFMFFFPMPMWVLVSLYAFLDLALLGGNDSIAHMAHLAGLALGLLLGQNWRKQGLQFPGAIGHGPKMPWQR